MAVFVRPNSVFFDACSSTLTLPSGMNHSEHWSGLSSLPFTCYLRYAGQLWNVSEDWFVGFITLTLAVEGRGSEVRQDWKEFWLYATHCSKHFIKVNSFILTTALWSVYSILQMRRPRHKVRKLAQYHPPVCVRSSIWNQAVWPQRPSSQSLGYAVSQPALQVPKVYPIS